MKKAKFEVTNMQTRTRLIRIRTEKEMAAQNDINPEALWLDQDITPEELLELDPLDPAELEEPDEEPELEDPILKSLPRRPWSNKLADIFMKYDIKELQKKHKSSESTEAFARRIRGSK